MITSYWKKVVFLLGKLVYNIQGGELHIEIQKKIVKDNFIFQILKKKCHSNELNLKERYVTNYSFMSLIFPKSLVFHEKSCVLETSSFYDVEMN